MPLVPHITFSAADSDIVSYATTAISYSTPAALVAGVAALMAEAISGLNFEGVKRGERVEPDEERGARLRVKMERQSKVIDSAAGTWKY